MTQVEKWEILTSIISVGILIMYFLVLNSLYQKNKAALLKYSEAAIISPSKSKFLFSWFVYFLIFYIPGIAVMWLLVPEEVFWVCLFLLPILWLFTSIPAYPYCIILIGDYILVGASVSAWMWRRIEMDLGEVDREKSMRYHFLRKMGIVIFHSVRGEKILTLGLDDVQISHILKASSNVVQQSPSMSIP